jgi:tRNA G18 (ribose-2'-O)-methylase SpoU
MPRNDRKLSMEEIVHAPPAADHPQVAVVLDDVRSRHNVGAIFRTADAFAVEKLWLCGFTPCPPHREIEKTALGATATVPWAHREDAAGVVRELQEQGWMVLAVEQTLHAAPLPRCTLPVGRPLALVLGNELHGVSPQVVEACDACITIPQFGSKHSLNVSVCAGIVLWWSLGPVAGNGGVSFGPPVA